MLLEEIRIRIADVDEFEGVLNCDLASAGQVVHQELHEVEEIAGFEASLVEDAPFVHEAELVLVDFPVEVLVDLPDPLVDFGFAVGEGEFGEDADHVLLVDGQSE